MQHFDVNGFYVRARLNFTGSGLARQNLPDKVVMARLQAVADRQISSPALRESCSV